MDEVNKMNSSEEEFNNSQQFTEEDLIDSLFVTCDADKVGKIPVSHLIEYLKFTTSAISENDEDLQNLGRLFNKGTDEGNMVDIITYRKVMKLWIDSIRKRNENESELDATTDDSSCLSKDISILRSMDSSVVETFGTEIDLVDQQNKIADLQHHNRKLTEENAKLRQQIDTQEDIVTVNNTEIDNLQKKIKSLLHTADLRQETITENEELKSKITQLQEKKKELTTRINHLDKEKVHFENLCSNLESQVVELTSDLEDISSQKEVIHKELLECKHKLSHAKELKGIQEIQLNERYIEVNSLKKQVKELSTELKECSKEKEEAKLELLQFQKNVSGGLPDWTGDGPEEMIPKVAGSFVCSTPMRQNQSLCMELKGMIGKDKCLPSPLCPKEFHKEYKLNPLPAFDEDDEDTEENTDELQLTTEISSFTEKFKHKQSELLAEIDSYFREEEGEEKKKLQTSLQKELAEMTEQMASLAIAKDSVDKRVNHLNQSMKKIREENALLRRMQHDSRSMLVECDRDLQSVVDRRLLLLKDKLEEEKDVIKNLKKELEEKNSILLKFKEMKYEEKIPKLEEEVNRLKKVNMELSEKCVQAEGQINRLQDDMTKSERDVEMEKHRSFELEESLYTNKLARQMDLKEIWRLVQKDVENECNGEKAGQSVFLDQNNSSDTMKERIFDEILALKSKFMNRKKEEENKPREKEILHECGRCSSKTASSPLLDALAIDFFNGNKPILPLSNNCLDLKDLNSFPSNIKTPGDDRDTYQSTEPCVQKLNNNSVLNLNCQSDHNRNCVDIKEDSESMISVEGSVRKLSYQSAIDNLSDDVFEKMSVCSEVFAESFDAKDNTNCNKHVKVQGSSDHQNRTGESPGSEDDYCWNDNMVVFDDDISYSSHSFSHLSYPFQPLRQDHIREETSIRDEEQTGNVLLEEREVDTEISQLIPSHKEDNNESDTSLSMTSALANKLQKLTLEDSMEKKTDELAIIHKHVMEKVELKLENPQLSKIRQNNLARRREQMKHIAIMPDLKESQESAMNGEDPGLVQEEKSVENGEEGQDNAVFPNIPDSFLKKHGLAYKKKEDVAASIHQLTDSEIENKFTSLSLAFKTDKLTLEKRLEIQERYRDLSEQNVEKEITGLRAALETICHLPDCVDSQVQDVLKKIRRHIDVLEQASNKVSSRAEVYGAVQQEKRMSKAIEVMIAHVENLKMAYEREHTELEEARKLIQDGRPFGATFDSDSGFASRRSASVCQGMNLTGQKLSRRRVSESCGPRTGSNGTLSHSVSLDFTHPLDSRYGLRKESKEDEDAKSKFQSAIASTVMKNTVTNSLRRNSSERLSVTSSEVSVEREKPLSKQNSKEEEAFQKGFEQGYKAQVGRDLSQLREQQNNVSQTLENIMDVYDKENEEEEKNLTDTIKEKFWETVPSWDSASKKFRMTMAGFVFFMALCSIVLSFFPVGQAAMQVQPQYRHMGQPPS